MTPGTHGKARLLSLVWCVLTHRVETSNRSVSLGMNGPRDTQPLQVISSITGLSFRQSILSITINMPDILVPSILSVALLAIFFQFQIAPIVETLGFFRVVETENRPEHCLTLPEVTGCESQFIDLSCRVKAYLSRRYRGCSAPRHRSPIHGVRYHRSEVSLDESFEGIYNTRGRRQLPRLIRPREQILRQTYHFTAF